MWVTASPKSSTSLVTVSKLYCLGSVTLSRISLPAPPNSQPNRWSWMRPGNFFDLEKLPGRIQDHLFGWLFGGAGKEILDKVTLPKQYNFDTVTKLVLDFGLAVTHISDLDLNFFKGVGTDVTGFDPDDLMEKAEKLGEFLHGDFFTNVTKNLEGLPEVVFTALKAGAMEYVKQQII